MNIGEIIQEALKREGRKQVWLVEKMNKLRAFIGKEEEYSTSLFSYKMKNGSFTVAEFLIICSILDINVEDLKKAIIQPVLNSKK